MQLISHIKVVLFSFLHLLCSDVWQLGKTSIFFIFLTTNYRGTTMALFCKHTYEVLHDELFEITTSTKFGETVRNIRTITQRCTKCGKIKIKHVHMNGSDF